MRNPEDQLADRIDDAAQQMAEWVRDLRDERDKLRAENGNLREKIEELEGAIEGSACGA